MAKISKLWASSSGFLLLFILALLTAEGGGWAGGRLTSILVLRIRSVQLHKSSAKQHRLQHSAHRGFSLALSGLPHIKPPGELRNTGTQWLMLMNSLLLDEILVSWHLDQWGWRGETWVWLSCVHTRLLDCITQLMFLFLGNPGETGPNGAIKTSWHEISALQTNRELLSCARQHRYTWSKMRWQAGLKCLVCSPFVLVCFNILDIRF